METNWTEETLEEDKKKCWGKTEKQNYLKPKTKDTFHCERRNHRIEDRSKQLFHLYGLVNLKVKQKSWTEKARWVLLRNEQKHLQKKIFDRFPRNKAMQALESGQFLFSCKTKMTAAESIFSLCCQNKYKLGFSFSTVIHETAAYSLTAYYKHVWQEIVSSRIDESGPFSVLTKTDD